MLHKDHYGMVSVCMQCPTVQEASQLDDHGNGQACCVLVKCFPSQERCVTDTESMDHCDWVND